MSDKDYTVDIILSILAYTRGKYTPEQVMELFYFIENSIEDTDSGSPILQLIKGINDGDKEKH